MLFYISCSVFIWDERLRFEIALILRFQFHYTMMSNRGTFLGVLSSNSKIPFVTVSHRVHSSLPLPGAVLGCVVTAQTILYIHLYARPGCWIWHSSVPTERHTRAHSHTHAAIAPGAKSNEPTINWTNHVYRICFVCIVQRSVGAAQTRSRTTSDIH